MEREDKFRDFARKSLNDVYILAGGKDTEEFAKITEEALHTNAANYHHQLAKLLIFLDPQNFVGQFAKMLRIKALQNVYTPVRLVQLDVTEMLPEVFLNPGANPAVKLDIYQRINSVIAEKVEEIGALYKAYLNPTVKLPQMMITKTAPKAGIIINKNKINVADLCENPYWSTKRVNMIICKEAGKFYCLNVETLLRQLAETGTAVNYYINQKLPAEIIDNLRKRYGTEIDAISKGENVEIGFRTAEEIVDLERTVIELEEFRALLNRTTVMEGLDLFGLEVIEDPNYDGVEGALTKIPPLIKDQFIDEFNGDTGVALEKMNIWLVNSIAEINGLINGDDDKDLDVGPVFAETSPQGNIAKLEEQLVKTQVFVENSLSKYVYDDYIARTLGIRQGVIDELKDAQTMAAREKLNVSLREANTILKDFRSKGRTIRGVISILQAALAANNERIEQVESERGMKKIYPKGISPAQQEIDDLEEFNKNVQTEILFLEELHKTFMEEHQK